MSSVYSINDFIEPKQTISLRSWSTPSYNSADYGLSSILFDGNKKTKNKRTSQFLTEDFNITEKLALLREKIKIFMSPIINCT